jgi:hypothetical protein
MEDTNAVSVDTLKSHGFTDEELAPHLQQKVKQEETSSEAATDVNQEAETEAERTSETVETSPAEGETSVKKHPKVVSYDRFKEVNDKYRVLEAEMAALKATKPADPAPVQQQPAPVQQQDIAAQIKEYAKREAMKKLKIEGNPADLMFTEPDKYEDYVAERAKIEYKEFDKYEKWQSTVSENAAFVREMQATPNFSVVFQFAERELDDLSRKEARKIDEAYQRVNNGQGTKDDFSTLREFYKSCADKMAGITAAPTPGSVSVSPTPAPVQNPLDKAAGLPRANNLSGAKTSAMSWAQVEQLIREGNIDQIPEDMLKRIDPRLIE